MVRCCNRKPVSWAKWCCRFVRVYIKNYPHQEEQEILGSKCIEIAAREPPRRLGRFVSQCMCVRTRLLNDSYVREMTCYYEWVLEVCVKMCHTHVCDMTHVCVAIRIHMSYMTLSAMHSHPYPYSTATPCNMLEHTATHCTTLQHAASRCNMLQHMQHAVTCCSTLQHAATCCNMLQHTATYCNILQHIATRCNTLQHTATCCNMLLHSATYCNMLQHIATHCNKLQYTATHYCNTLQHTATHYNMLQHTATHCNTLHNTATHCNTLQHTEVRVRVYVGHEQTHMCIVTSIWHFTCKMTGPYTFVTRSEPPIISNLKYKIWAHRLSIKDTRPPFIVIKAIIIITCMSWPVYVILRAKWLVHIHRWHEGVLRFPACLHVMWRIHTCVWHDAFMCVWHVSITCAVYYHLPPTHTLSLSHTHTHTHIRTHTQLRAGRGMGTVSWVCVQFVQGAAWTDEAWVRNVARG